tara:strand:+ start:7980 stop:8573 length:594 start_codon:yes stop_codon:yes gene_type:complete
MKSNNLKQLSLLSLVFLTVLTACQSDYTKLVNKEMNSGIVYDSILFGLKFGDSRNKFFERCMELNKKKLVSQGPNNNYVQYRLPNTKDENTLNTIDMLFYGKFDEKSNIKAMDLKFNYASWSPWNENQHAIALVPVIMDTILKWYPGNEFMEVTKKDETKVMVKVDGNRQITLFPEENTKDVSVLIEDLRIKIKNTK